MLFGAPNVTAKLGLVAAYLRIHTCGQDSPNDGMGWDGFSRPLAWLGIAHGAFQNQNIPPFGAQGHGIVPV